ncbi:hypothetical protein AC578_8077 [Pseudocercospora eumusae]|uniref:Uncharacterized protein n=1 Tax=Pseudocercospora eumusae TaxID=321146 RepID=A0A139H7N0_9PEZI|nr:hypothetical protein AC578_8077 [Pseudocercospora eumusae]
MSAQHSKDSGTTAVQGEMLGQPGLRKPSIYKEPIQLNIEHSDQRWTSNKKQSIFSDTDCSPGLLSPPIFDPEELRKCSDVSLDSEHWALLSKWERSKSRPNVIDEIEARQESPDRVPTRQRRSSLVAVEVQHWSREYDPADPDNYDEGISPMDVRRFSADVRKPVGQHRPMEALFPSPGALNMPVAPKAVFSVRPSLSVHQPGPPLKAALSRPQAEKKHTHSRNDTRVSRFSEFGIHPPTAKSGRESTSTMSSNKFRLGSREWCRPSRCGLLPSLPESLIEQSMRAPMPNAMLEFRMSGDPLESRIWKRDSNTAYDVMREALKSKRTYEHETEHVFSRTSYRSEMDSPTRSQELVQAWLNFQEFGPVSWRKGASPNVPSSLYYTWWACNIGLMGSTVFCLVHAVLHSSPETLLLAVVSGTSWLMLLGGAYLWRRRLRKFNAQRRHTGYTERSPLLPNNGPPVSSA